MNDIYGIQASEKEILEFGRQVKVRGQGVEIYLKNIEDFIAVALQKRVKEAYNNYYENEENGVARALWVMNEKHPS